MVDPAALGVGGDDGGRAGRIGRHDLAVVAAGDDAVCVGSGREDRAAVDRDAPLLAIAREQQRLLAEHEDGGLS